MRGRPRDARLDERIPDVAARTLRELGYRGFTVDAVARECEVARTTIYSRWPTRGHLLDATLARMIEVPADDHDDEREPREVLIELVRHDVELAGTVEGRAVVHHVLAARDPDGQPADLLAAALHGRREAYRRVLARFPGAAGVPDDVEMATDMVLGVVWQQMLLPPPAAFDIERLVVAVERLLGPD